MPEHIRETAIPGLFVIERPTHRDGRGFFREVVRFNELAEALGHAFRPVQVNHSFSQPKVIRALHAENWNKLVYPVSGRMFAAIVDIRPNEPTFGNVETFTFDENEPKALFVSKGLANSICVSGAKPVHYLYLVDAYYDGNDTRAVAWDDPDLAIDWPVKNPIISERDRSNPTLRELFPAKFEARRKCQNPNSKFQMKSQNQNHNFDIDSLSHWGIHLWHLRFGLWIYGGCHHWCQRYARSRARGGL